VKQSKFFLNLENRFRFDESPHVDQPTVKTIEAEKWLSQLIIYAKINWNLT
jgi:hypothetical protein